MVARVGDKAITLGELDATIRNELYEAREQALDRMVTEQVLEAAAKKAGLSPSEFLQHEVTARVPEVSEKEAKEFFEKNKDRLHERYPGKTFDELRPLIVGGLTGEKREEAVVPFVEELKAKAGAKVLLDAPKVEVAATGPARGPDGAKVTIVEFSDFQCPFCARVPRRSTR